ncbi:hypothetical protein HGO53_05370 [Wolbachia endosymbiont of Diaphorina citri]|jgi:hypothetical protein|uniref:hypothetical protein n=1 Tax=Wolbachia endosymbiont of Diaphorina citri TaxID=116598 RepID=UPI0003005E41|nr:hypothetical protein [Wolbachia endosymbiont of Diaphorina citri]QJT94664.1 hypothetical protein HGO48_04660 [Wolbachia endosymbiont of Diaphorina citri]QJT95903.1 hypothetical protein HGO49_04660 [Wolbachia endosymbiont of Diaphorina citri]QJT97265.1 hypothetical protein HGO53_05370 [Wolbachia endosymbiont of Diaphorina citri]QLK11561.1 hypothetical protein FK497_04720 [Wolbachia endosymbiont of Diaphorina citri]QXY86906.1 hypothetical protein GZ064_02885 [Wolbachia endosymbiont of Diaphor
MAKIEIIKNKYKNEGLWSAVKEVPVQGWDLVKENPYKTAATFAAIALVTSLTAAYFLSPAYATFVGTVGTKAATLVSPAITAMSALAIAHPLVASLIIVAVAAALITASTYAYKNSGKAGQIEEVVKILNENSTAEPNTKLDNIKQILGLQPAQSV